MIRAGIVLPDLEIGHEGDAAAHGVADHHQVMQVPGADELRHHVGLVADGIFAVLGLGRQAEALEINGQDPVILGQGRAQKAPGIGGGPEPVQQDDRGPLPGLVIVDLDAVIVKDFRLTQAVPGSADGAGTPAQPATSRSSNAHGASILIGCISSASGPLITC